MSIKRYPPSFSDTKKYPPQYNLENIDVFLEANPGDYFNVTGLPEEIGFGKHSFNLFVDEPSNGLPLKNYGNILIEAKDADGNLIYSGITKHSDISGAVICFIWIKQDPLLTEKNIVDGVGTLTIVGQLSNVPNQYRDVYNLRTTIPLNIRRNYANTSPILFESASKIQTSLSISEKLESDIDNANFNRSYADITLENLQTFSGEVEKIQISYLESGSLSALTEEDYTFLTQHTIQKTSASFEDEIDFRIADGLNPISQSFRVLMPTMANQSGSEFGLADNKFKFKFEFLNKNNEKAKAVTTNENLEITSSFIDFAGPATVITGEDNLIAGQLFVGSSLSGAGLEFNGGSSAFLRSIGYLGFTSASAGSGSGFMMYSGSVLTGNTDDYEQGGVGFEFVSSSEAFFRFNTHPGLFDVRAKSFFVGSDTTQFISGSGQNIEISSSKFHLKTDGSVTMSGKLAVEAGGTIGGFTISDDALSTTAFILSSSQNQNDPGSFISSSKFKVSAGGVLTASAAFIEGAVITGSTNIDVANDIKVRGTKIAQLSADDSTITLGDTNAIITASSGLIADVISTHITASSITASGEVFTGNIFTGNISSSGEIVFNQTLDSTTGIISSSGAISASKIIGADGAFFSGDVDVIGNVTATTFTTQIIQSDFSEGSTIFGNSEDDKHMFTGSVSIHHTGSRPGLFLTGSELRVENNISASDTIIAKSGSFSHIVIDRPFDSANEEFFQIKRDGDTKFVVDEDGDVITQGVFNQEGTTPNQFAGTIGGGSGYTTNFIQFNSSAPFISDNGDVMIKWKNDDYIKLNQEREQVDIWLSSENDAYNLFSDGTNDKIGIGTNTPTHKLTVAGDISASGIVYASRFEASGSGTGITFVDNLDITGDISASGDIIASGNISGSSTSTGSFGNIEIPDDGQINLGDENDLQIFHRAGVYSRIKDSGTGPLQFSSNRFKFMASDNSSFMIDATSGGAVDLYHNNNKKLETTETGINITGEITASGNISASGDLSLTGDIVNVTHITASGGISASSAVFKGDIDVDGTTNLDIVDIDGAVDMASTLTLNDNTTTTGNISSPSFESGFAGSGFSIDSVDDKTSFTIDNLTVRSQLSVFEMLIHQIRATNGSLFVSNTGRIISSSMLEGGSVKKYHLFFDTGSGYGHTFRPGDIIRAQRFTPDTNGSGSDAGPASYKSDLTIESVIGISESIARLTGSINTEEAPQPGYEYVRLGNVKTGSRQGSIYLTADDAHAPFIDVADEVTKHSDFNTSGKIKTRIGKLSGVNSARFGGLTGYGFYASGSAFLEGSINADKGSIGGWGISNSVISSSNITLDSTNENILLGSATALDSGTGVFLNGSGHFRAGDPNNNFIKFDGTDISVTAGNFSLNTAGDMTATNADLTGKISSTEGSIGGFGIGADAITGSAFFISGSGTGNDFFISSSGFNVKASGDVTASALILTGSNTTNFLRYKDGNLTVRGDVAATTLSTTKFSVNAEGQITASAGTIGGFEITSTELKSGSKIVLDASQSKLVIGGDDNTRFGTDGIQLEFNAGTPRAFIGHETGSSIKFDGTNFKITSSNVNISGSDVRIGAPRFLFGDTTNFISGSNGNLKINTNDATISGSSVKIITKRFLFGDNKNFISGSSHGSMSIVANNITMSGSSVNISTPSFFFGKTDTTLENAAFISGSQGVIEISASNFHLKNGNITASNVDLSGKITSQEGSIGGFSIDASTISSSNGTLILNNLGQITASAVSMSGTIVTDDINATGGTIGGFSLDSSKLSSGNLFTISASSTSGELFISSSAFKVKNTGQITGSNVLFSGGEIGGFKISSTELSASGLKLKTADRFTDGQITSSNVLFEGGKIGGFTISNQELSIDNIKLSSKEKGLVISSSTGVGKLKIASGSLTNVLLLGTTTNFFVQPSFEEFTANTIITASTPTNIGPWYFENDTATGATTEELWNSGSISMSVADSDAADGSKHITINVHRELGPEGFGPAENPT